MIKSRVGGVRSLQEGFGAGLSYEEVKLAVTHVAGQRMQRLWRQTWEQVLLYHLLVP